MTDNADISTEKPSLFSRFRGFLKLLGALMVEVTAAVAFLVFLTIVGFLGYEQIRHWIFGPQTDNLVRRDFLCTDHLIERPPEGASSLEVIAADISLLKEKARTFAQPQDPIGRISTFIGCATVSGVSTSGVDLQLGGQFTQLAGLPAGELIALEREEITEIKRLFPSIPKRIIGKIDAKLLAAERIQLDIQRSQINQPGGGDFYVDPQPSVDPNPDLPAIPVPAPPPPPPPPESEPAKDAGRVAAIPLDDAQWVLVAGADKSAAAAADQVRQTRNVIKDFVDGGENVGVFLIRDWHRTVIPVASRAQAEEVLNRVQATLPYGAYARKVLEWCDQSPTKQEGYWSDLKAAPEVPIDVYQCSE